MDPATGRWLAMATGVALVLIALAVYTTTLTERYYDHFVWQASAFLEGQTAIRYPTPENEMFQDVLPIVTTDGVPRGQIPFPPLPALLLLPFVAIWGFATNDQLVFAVLGAIDVGICWWLLGRIPVGVVVRLATTLFFAFGTVFWYTSQLATTWFQAHIVAVGLTMLAIGVAIGGDPQAAVIDPSWLDDEDDDDAWDHDDRSAAAVPARAGSARPLSERAGIGLARLGAVLAVDRRQLLAGFLFGLACTARLTVLFGAPFFLLVGSGGSWWRRGWSASLGAAIPVLGLVLYNLATTGHVFHPAYDHLYQLEALVYWPLGYDLDWAIEDPRYLPQNLGIMFASLPDLFPTTLPDSLGVNAIPVCTEPGAVRTLFDVACPLAVPRDIGMSVLMTSPAFLLIAPGLRWYGRSRLVTGCALAILLIALVNLMHFSQGWVQFGYRFSNDFVPWALVLVALGFERIRRLRWGTPVAMALVVVAIAVNLWGVIWGGLLGW
jgi:hypothetical protein